MSDTALGAIIGLAGVLVGAIGTIGVTWIREHYQDKREKEKLVYDLGKIYWQEALIKARESGRPTYVYPLESFIISVKYLFQEITNNNLDEKKVKELLARHSKVNSIVKKHYDKKG